jgi:hypothetical protein
MLVYNWRQMVATRAEKAVALKSLDVLTTLHVLQTVFIRRGVLPINEAERD